jgi:hypothetical protein
MTFYMIPDILLQIFQNLMKRSKESAVSKMINGLIMIKSSRGYVQFLVAMFFKYDICPMKTPFRK